MPTYEYLCRECGERLEVFQKFTDKPLRVHPDCGGELQKVFHASGIVFKGSGYYLTDSRSSKKSASTPSNGSNGSDKKSEKKTDSPKSDSSSKSDSSAAAAD